MLNSCIWAIDMTLSGATTPGQIQSGSNGNERVVNIPKHSRTGVTPLDSLMSYTGHSLQGGDLSYPSVGMQSVYSTAPANWTLKNHAQNIFIYMTRETNNKWI